MEDYVKDEIKEVEGADSVNELLKELKGIQKDWGSLYGPINKHRNACLKAAKLDKTPGSSIKHVLLGLPLVMVAE